MDPFVLGHRFMGQITNSRFIQQEIVSTIVKHITNHTTTYMSRHCVEKMIFTHNNCIYLSLYLYTGNVNQKKMLFLKDPQRYQFLNKQSSWNNSLWQFCNSAKKSLVTKKVTNDDCGDNTKNTHTSIGRKKEKHSVPSLNSLCSGSKLTTGP